MAAALDKAFIDVYTKFKLQFYRKIFSRFETREASLTAVETFCVEVIDALKNPTVSDFAKFVNISQANAAYKIQNLVKKGYVSKERSQEDKREYRLSVTDKFYEYNRLNTDYVSAVVKRIDQRFTKEEVATFERILNVISEDLMPEVPAL
ncbi:MAG: MarR family transcriptional regulator [Coriobacteriales bacterium]|nr:MarR family transcriptional regulator [Coriobacteriales bacterium]